MPRRTKTVSDKKRMATKSAPPAEPAQSMATTSTMGTTAGSTVSMGKLFSVACLVLAMGFVFYEGTRFYRFQRGMQELSMLVQPMGGMRVQLVGRTLFLTGELSSLEDWAKARAIAQSFAANHLEMRVENMTRLTDQAKQMAAMEMRKQIGNRYVKVGFLGERFVLEGTVRNDFEADRAVEIAKAVLLLGSQTATRDTAEAPDSMENAPSDAFAPVLLDMLKTRTR